MTVAMVFVLNFVINVRSQCTCFGPGDTGLCDMRGDCSRMSQPPGITSKFENILILIVKDVLLF